MLYFDERTLTFCHFFFHRLNTAICLQKLKMRYKKMQNEMLLLLIFVQSI